MMAGQSIFMFLLSFTLAAARDGHLKHHSSPLGMEMEYGEILEKALERTEEIGSNCFVEIGEIFSWREI